jgi:hypothetical protein
MAGRKSKMGVAYLQKEKEKKKRGKESCQKA